MTAEPYDRDRPDGLPRRREQSATLELDDIQGNLVRGYTEPVGTYVFVRVSDPARGRAWLSELLPDVASAKPDGEQRPATRLNLSFTYAGLAALGVPDDVLATFSDPFREGMAARAEILGDTGENAPEHWDPGFGTGDAHVLVTMYGVDDAALEGARSRLQTLLDAAGDAVAVVHEQRSQVLPGGRDHFGFTDGIAQPPMKGGGAEARPGDGLPMPGGQWQDVEDGEFVLGYVDGDGGLPVAPAAPFDRNSTYVVYRKLAMFPARFRAYLRAVAGEHDPDVLAAKIVGRWQDGTPLVGSPHGPDPAIAQDPARVNNYRYGSDPEGLECPIGSHVRRVNPRDDEQFFGGLLSARHRIIRRGRAYGPVLPDGADDDGAERGLIFKCYQADIERQFEMIQSLWVDDGDAFGLGDAKDPLIGSHVGNTGQVVIQGRPPIVLPRMPAFTQVRGGEYLIRPGLRALRWLATQP